MSKFPMIEAMGLQVVSVMETSEVMAFEGIHAAELEKALQDAPKIIQSDYYGIEWTETNEILGGKTGRENIATKSARLVCIQPIKKKTKAEAALELLAKIHSGDSDWSKSDIEKVLEMEDNP